MNIHDVVNFAVRIEENGERFYREAAEVITNQPVKELFERLAQEEIGHRKTFERLLSSLGEYNPPETYEGEYLAYLKDFIDGKAIFKDHPKIGQLTKASSIPGALDFAIQRELDSILYYQEIKKLVDVRRADAIDLIIGEERKHFALLSKLRREAISA
ncbi:MAG: ferritin family protein [Syntrophales bacterium LBB04]|nr:ferritin family protein [Syntrophales bacterium LBB04]